MNEKPIAREIRKYNIVSITEVRGIGSRFGGHERRCMWKICDKPMLQWALEVPLASKYVNKVVLSSEDKEILKFGEKIDGVIVVPRSVDTIFQVPRDWGVGVFQMQRPRSLFGGEHLRETDPRNVGFQKGQLPHAPIRYCLWYLQEYESYITDIEILVTANEPMSTTKTLDELIEAFFLDEEANDARTFYPIMPYIFTINPKTGRPFPLIFSDGLDRQMYPPIYRQGPFRIYGGPVKRTYTSDFKIAYVIVSPEEGMDIHNEEDLFLANCHMRRRLARQKNEEHT